MWWFISKGWWEKPLSHNANFPHQLSLSEQSDSPNHIVSAYSTGKLNLKRCIISTAYGILCFILFKQRSRRQNKSGIQPLLTRRNRTCCTVYEGLVPIKHTWVWTGRCRRWDTHTLHFCQKDFLHSKHDIIILPVCQNVNFLTKKQKLMVIVTTTVM